MKSLLLAKDMQRIPFFMLKMPLFSGNIKELKNTTETIQE